MQLGERAVVALQSSSLISFAQVGQECPSDWGSDLPVLSCSGGSDAT